MTAVPYVVPNLRPAQDQRASLLARALKMAKRCTSPTKHGAAVTCGAARETVAELPQRSVLSLIVCWCFAAGLSNCLDGGSGYREVVQWCAVRLACDIFDPLLRDRASGKPATTAEEPA